MLKKFPLVLIGIILLYLLPFSWTMKVRDLSARAVYPVGHYLVEKSSDLHNFVANIRQISRLRDDKASLQTQVVKLQKELTTKETVVRENEALRKELGVTNTTREQKKVFVRILLVGSDIRDRTIIVDAGSNQGIAIDQAAIYQGSLVGKVISVRENSAVIRLVISKESKIQVWIASNREKGLLGGDGNQLLLTDVTQGISAEKGSLIETSGLGGALPQGILVGEIGETTSKKSNLSQTFSVKSAIDPLGIESLFVLLTDR